MFKGFICCESCTLKNRRALPLKFPSFCWRKLCLKPPNHSAELKFTRPNLRYHIPFNSIASQRAMFQCNMHWLPMLHENQCNPSPFQAIRQCSMQLVCFIKFCHQIQQSPLPKFHFVNGLLHWKWISAVFTILELNASQAGVCYTICYHLMHFCSTSVTL